MKRGHQFIRFSPGENSDIQIQIRQGYKNKIIHNSKATRIKRKSQ